MRVDRSSNRKEPMKTFVTVLEAAMAVILVSMLLLLGTNVILRYAFSSGIEYSDELSRYLFVWLTFIGAYVVSRDNQHLNVDSGVSRLGPRGRRICMALADAVVLVCCAVLMHGTWKQAGVDATNHSPVAGIPLVWVYGIGFFGAFGMGAHAAIRLYRNSTGRIGEDELREFAGEYEGGPTGARVE